MITSFQRVAAVPWNREDEIAQTHLAMKIYQVQE